MNRRRLRATLLACLLAAVTVLVATACGAKQDTISPGTLRPLRLMLDFFPNADHAAIYEAIADGDFRAVGLDVQPQVPSDPSAPLKLLAAGRVDMAISYEPELLLARDQGYKLISIAALVQRPLTSVIAIGSSHVTSIADLANKTVGTAGIAYQTAELNTILNHAGVSPSTVTEVNVGFNLVPAMLSGKVAATIGGFWNYEAIQLQMLHKRPVVIPVDEAGVPTYNEFVLVVRRGEAERRGQDLRGFLHALTLGEQAVRANPARAAQLIEKANPDLSLPLQLASIKHTLPAAVPPSGQPFGYQDPAAWTSFAAWMHARGLVRQDPGDTSMPFTNEFLPGQGI